MNKLRIMALAAATMALASTVQAGGRGGGEVGLAGYGSGVGAIAAFGFPISIPALEDNSLNTYGEAEVGVGFADEVSFGADVSVGLLLNLERGLDIYGSLGPGIGGGNEADFGLAAEVGMNILINDRFVFIEGGAHPGNGYFTVGLHF